MSSSEHGTNGETKKKEDGERDATAGMSPTAKAWIELGPYLGIGWMFVFSLGGFAALGWWLDQKLGTGRKLLIAGSIFGIVVGFANLYKVVLALDQRKNKR